MEVKDIISRRRQELGLTMKDVATFVGVSEGTVSRWESGDIDQMKRSRIERLAECLQISPLVILGYSVKEAASEETALTDMQMRLIAAVRKLTPEQQEAWLRVLETQT